MTATQGGFSSASLYVGDLHSDVNEATLFEVFREYHVDTIHVCRDALTRKSLGYAYVNFRSSSDADVALDSMNGQPIKDKPCRIMKSQRDPSARRSNVGNVFIKNLEKTITNVDLLDTFSKFGAIHSAKVVTDDEGKSKGYGFVHFESQDSAEKAIQTLNGKAFNGVIVHIGHFIPKRERMAQSNAQFTNVYVKNMPEDVTEEMLRDELLKDTYGTVLSCIIMRDESKKSKGFGFVNFESHEMAAKVVEQLNNTEFRGKTLFVGRAMKKSERAALLRDKFEAMKHERDNKYQGINLYVKNLTEETDDDKLRTEFLPFGNITSVRVMRDERNVSRGFGFVCYTSTDEAMRAVHEMNGRLLNNKPLYVAVAQRKEDRRRNLAIQYETRPRGPGNAQMAAGMMPQAAMYQGMYPYVQRYPMPYAPQAMQPQGRWGAPQQQYRQAQAPVQVPQVQQPAQSAEEKTKLGMELYARVQQKQPTLAPKITGMLIELDVAEIHKLLASQPALDAKVAEAMQVLDEAQKAQPARQ
jgi:polyadenylate-binding protein